MNNYIVGGYIMNQNLKKKEYNILILKKYQNYHMKNLKKLVDIVKIKFLLDYLKYMVQMNVLKIML